MVLAIEYYIGFLDPDLTNSDERVQLEEKTQAKWEG